jgi:hypothetical protein
MVYTPGRLPLLSSDSDILPATLFRPLPRDTERVTIRVKPIVGTSLVTVGCRQCS